MPSLLEKAYEFIKRPQPISAIWSIEGKEFPGTLEWVNNEPRLTISEKVRPEEGDSKRHRSFLTDLFNAHGQCAVFGVCSGFGGVFLDRCVALELNSTDMFPEHPGYHQLKLLPHEIWFSPKVVDRKSLCTQTCLSDDRLHGVFRDGSIRQIDRFDDQFKATLSALGDPQMIWAGFAPSSNGIALGATGLELTTSSSLLQSFSATEGKSASIVSTLKLTESEKSQDLTINDHLKAVMKLEALISAVSLSRFEFRCIEFLLDYETIAAQIWTLGDQPNKFDAPMQHQVITNLADGQTLKKAIESWFTKDEVFELAIWVFHKAITETESGVARFLLICQAYEILGRTTKTRHKKMPRDQLNDAVERISRALGDDFPKDQIERWQNLIRSSNRASFSDTLEGLFPTHLVALVDSFGSGSVQEYARSISDLRNALIHMSGKKAGDLDAAYGKVNKASYQMTLLFLLTVIGRMGLPAHDLQRFLLNNSSSRLAFPSEMLRH